MDIHKILILEPEALLRDLLVGHLGKLPQFEVVGACSSISEAQANLRRVTPDLLLLDTQLSDGCGLDFASGLLQTNSGLRVVFLTSQNSATKVLEAAAIESHGYLLRTHPIDTLVFSIDLIASGMVVYDPEVTTPILRSLGKAHLRRKNAIDGLPLDRLSETQRRIAGLTAEGLSNQEIADASFLSVNTVKTHLRNIFRELGIQSRRELQELLPNLPGLAQPTAFFLDKKPDIQAVRINGVAPKINGN